MGGIPHSTHCTCSDAPARADLDVSTSAKDLVSAGACIQESGGESSAPRQVNAEGKRAPSSNAELASVNTPASIASGGSGAPASSGSLPASTPGVGAGALAGVALEPLTGVGCAPLCTGALAGGVFDGALALGAPGVSMIGSRALTWSAG